MLESFLPLSYSGLQEGPLDLSKTANLSAEKDRTHAKMSDPVKSHLCAIDMEELLRTYLVVSNASEQPTACAAQFPIPTAHSPLSQSQAVYIPTASDNLSIRMTTSLPSAPTILLSTSLQQPSAQAQVPPISFQQPSGSPPLPSAQTQLPSTSAYPPLTSAAAQLPSTNCSHASSTLDLASSPPQPSIPPSHLSSHICLSSMQPNFLSSLLPFFFIPTLNSPLLTADGFSNQQWLNNRKGSSENIAGEQHLSERALKLAERYDESAMVKRRRRQNERRLKAAKRSAVPAEACNCRFCYEDHILKLRQRAAVWSEG
jgi:hypothetical protein